MKKLMSLVVFIPSAVCAANQLDIVFVDSFKAMRECKEGVKVGKELDSFREKLSKEIQVKAEKLAKEESKLQAEAGMLKKDVLEKRSREIEKKRRDLKDEIEVAEAEMKNEMQRLTEALAAQTEESLVEVAKAKGVDVVIDKTTGRVLYSKEGNKGDLTADTIAQLDKKVSAAKPAVAA